MNSIYGNTGAVMENLKNLWVPVELVLNRLLIWIKCILLLLLPMRVGINECFCFTELPMFNKVFIFEKVLSIQYKAMK